MESFGSYPITCSSTSLPAPALAVANFETNPAIELAPSAVRVSTGSDLACGQVVPAPALAAPACSTKHAAAVDPECTDHNSPTSSKFVCSDSSCRLSCSVDPYSRHSDIRPEPISSVSTSVPPSGLTKEKEYPVQHIWRASPFYITLLPQLMNTLPGFTRDFAAFDGKKCIWYSLNFSKALSLLCSRFLTHGKMPNVVWT